MKAPKGYRWIELGEELMSGDCLLDVLDESYITLPPSFIGTIVFDKHLYIRKI